MNYTLILNSNNRVDKANTNANDSEYLFDFSVLPEGKYKISYAMSKFEPRVETFSQLIARRPPWGMYNGGSYQSAGNVIPDMSINNRGAFAQFGFNVPTGIGNRATVQFNVLAGNTNSIVAFPTGSLPTNYSLCSLTRYSGAVKTKVLSGDSSAFGSGFGPYAFPHFLGNNNSVYDGVFASNRIQQGGLEDWTNMCIVNGNSILFPNNVLINNNPVGVDYLPIKTTPGKLGINVEGGGENSDFELAWVIIWDVQLTQTELKTVSNAFEKYLITGVLS